MITTETSWKSFCDVQKFAEECDICSNGRQMCRTSNPGLRSTPSKFSKFNNCVKAGNASSARLFNKNARGYPKILPCNARK